MPDSRLELAVRTAGAALARATAELHPRVRVIEEGRIRSVADGVVRIAGLPGAVSDELLALSDGGHALVLGLGKSDIEAIALDDARRVSIGTRARTTGRAATIPVGDALLGRVVDPLGRPLDGEPLTKDLHPTPLERRAPHIHERSAVHRPLLTGLLAVDAMLPIGRGQRELVLGDEGSGKTSLALDVIVRQKSTDVTSVYVAIGRRRAEIWQIVESLRRLAGRWVIVAAPEDASPGLRYLAPYAGCAVAEHFTYRGEHALVVYDDLTAHAVAWRELSLLLQRPPGREAYPGDIFYLHSRLLERAAQLSGDLGGGSLTALPLAVLEGGRLTAYIPTNLISITDGQIVLSESLFASGQKPAIDAGLSVSRVGAKAQPQALRALAARMRLDYAAFLELEAYSRLGTRLEESTRRRIEVGRRVRALLRARRLSPLGIFDEVVRLVLAADHDLLLRIPRPLAGEVAGDLVGKARRALSDIAGRIDRDAVLSEADQSAILEFLRRELAERFGAGRDAG